MYNKCGDIHWIEHVGFMYEGTTLRKPLVQGVPKLRFANGPDVDPKAMPHTQSTPHPAPHTTVFQPSGGRGSVRRAGRMNCAVLKHTMIPFVPLLQGLSN